jgi:glycosyltransferase involved in cell wall biosynthesis
MHMRVLQLISSKGHYGAESMLLSLCEALKPLSWRPVVGMIHNSLRPNLETAKRARSLGLEVVVFDCAGRLDWSAARKICNYLQDQKVNLIHTHGYKADIYGFAAARGLHIPMIATCHSLPNRQTQSTGLDYLYGFLDRLVLRSFERVVAVSSELADSLQKRGIQQERIAMIHNGVPIMRFAKASPTFSEEINKGKRTVVGMIARLAPGKNPDLFLQAAQSVLKGFPNTVFAMIGNGPERNKLEGLVRKLKIEDSVVFAGERHDMPEVYASLDIVVLPSLSEGMPMSILEAMAAGKPIVASSVGAIPSVVLPDQTGLLIEPGDLVGLRAAMERLLSDPELRTRLGEEGQTMINRHYSADVMAHKYLHVYQRVLDRQAAA